MSEQTTVPQLIDHDEVIDVIKTVYDPEIPVDIFELGLIYEVNIDEKNNIEVIMTLTSPSCPSAQSIPEEVRKKVSLMDGAGEVKVDITFDPPWTKEMMSDIARLQLGFM